MAKNIFQVVMPVSEYGLGYNYIKYLLDSADKGAVKFEVSSLGGDLNQAKQVKKLFADHEDLTLSFFGYCASATTVLGHGLPIENTEIYSDAWFMIHQPLIWVEEWGRMNADDLANTIESLKAQQESAALQTLQMAKEYADYTGQPVEKMLSIMKEEKWLTAQQAVDLGLVGKVIPAVKGKKPILTNEVLAMITANALPPIPESSTVTDEEKTLFQRFLNFTNNSHNKNKPQMNKDLSFVNQVLKVEGVNVAENKVEITLDQLTIINNEIKTKTEAVATLTAEKDTAVTDKATAETALVEATTKIDAIHPNVKAATTVEAKVAAINAELAKRPAAKIEKPTGEGGDVITDADFDVIDSLPHNQAADKSV